MVLRVYLVNFTGKRISHWVVEHPVHYLLPRTGIINVTVKDLAYAVDACGFVVVGPEVFLDVFDCVDAEPVDYILVSFWIGWYIFC